MFPYSLNSTPRWTPSNCAGWKCTWLWENKRISTKGRLLLRWSHSGFLQWKDLGKPQQSSITPTCFTNTCATVHGHTGPVNNWTYSYVYVSVCIYIYHIYLAYRSCLPLPTQTATIEVPQDLPDWHSQKQVLKFWAWVVRHAAILQIIGCSKTIETSPTWPAKVLGSIISSRDKLLWSLVVAFWIFLALWRAVREGN